MGVLTSGFLIYASASAASVFALGLAIPRRDAPGGRWLVAFLGIHAAWMALNALVYTDLSVDTRVTLLILASVVSVAPGLLLMFAVEHAQPSHRVATGILIPLAVVPAIIIALAFTNSLHGLYIESAFLDPGGTGVLVTNYGALYGAMVYMGAPVLLVTAGILILTASRSPGAIRTQAVLITIGVIIQTMAYLYVLALPERPLGIEPAMASVFVGVAIAVALYGSGLLQLVPVGWAEALNILPDGFIITDTSDTIVDANPAAIRLINYRDNRTLLGVPISSAFARWDCAGLPCVPAAFSEELTALDPLDSDVVPLGVQRWRLRGPSAEIIGSAYVVRDNSGTYWTRQQLSVLQQSLTSWNDDMHELEQLLKRFS